MPIHPISINHFPISATVEHAGKACANAYTKVGKCDGWKKLSKETCIQVYETLPVPMPQLRNSQQNEIANFYNQDYINDNINIFITSSLQYCKENKSPNPEICPAPEGGCRYAMINENGGWCQLTGNTCDWKDRKKKSVIVVDTKEPGMF